MRNTGFEEKADMMRLLSPLIPGTINSINEDYWLQMTETQIKELAESEFVTIGAHGYYHNDLSQIDIAGAETELLFSKRYLECIIGKPVDSFAFPYGSYTAKIVTAAKAAGYKQLLATDFNSLADYDDGYMRERFTVNPFISINNQMHAIIMGKYDG